jgi:hypothetical protein
MTEVSIDELKQARYMGLTSPPASPEVKRLVDSIIVKKKDQKIALETLEGQFLGRATIEPRLKVKRC